MYEPRSQYELGDPVAEQLRREEQTDHHRAKARGERVARMAEAIVLALEGRGLLRARHPAMVEIVHVLANHLYSQDTAIDIVIPGEPHA